MSKLFLCPPLVTVRSILSKSYVWHFPVIQEFANTAESMFKNTERRTDLDKWYVRLMSTTFETIQNVAGDHPKTPPEVVKMGKIYERIFKI